MQTKKAKRECPSLSKVSRRIGCVAKLTRGRTRAIWLLTCTVLAGGAMLAACGTAGEIGQNATTPATPPAIHASVTSTAGSEVIPTPPPPPAQIHGVSYAGPTSPPKVSMADAIVEARSHGISAEWPDAKITAIYVLLTDERVNVPNEAGTPVARNEPVWIVTAQGIPKVPSGPAPPPGTPRSVQAYPTTVNVVIDAMTGRWIETYSY
jgi:hypothetical protein